MPTSPSPDPARFENVLQVGGIRTGTLDHPNPLGGQSCRVAHVNTGGGLRFTVALDRGGDLVEAFFHQHSLTYLSPNGYVPPSESFQHGDRWLRSWPTGLLTTCGPMHIGAPRTEDGVEINLHGHHANTPAAVEMVLNPDPHARPARREMLLSLVVRDSRFYGPVVEVRRQVQCALGVNDIVIHDTVTNRGNTPAPHHWLYHVNLGYPLLDAGARFVYRGRARQVEPAGVSATAAQLEAMKLVPAPLEEHAGESSRIVFVEPPMDEAGRARVGLINEKLGLGFEIDYPADVLPRLANWQHFGRGCYVSGLEPFTGTIRGRAADPHPSNDLKLQPGESRRYRLVLRVREAEELAELAACDGAVEG